jgi:D-amino-acid oxidase
MTWNPELEPSTRMISRRALLRGGAALTMLPVASALSPNARAAPLRPDRLGTPDFNRLAQSARYVVGVRPHRIGGVRLALEAPVDTPRGKKWVIHNYGHGGAGITLSWGCASVVRDHVTTVMRELPGRAATRGSVAIIGSGIVGLTVASELRAKWPQLPITIYAKSLDMTRTTSWKAGGQFAPSGIWRQYDTAEERATLHDLVRRSAAKIRQFQDLGPAGRAAFGVAQRNNYLLDRPDDAFDEGTPRDVIPEVRRGTLPFAELNEIGREYRTWLVNPTIMMPKLILDLKAKSVAFRQRNFLSEDDVLALAEPIIVNCTGFGSKSLFGDTDLKAQRGHLLVLPNPQNLKYFFSGGCSNDVVAYMFCRQTDIVIGGTVVSDDERDFVDSNGVDRQACDTLLSNMREIFRGNTTQCMAPQTA